MRVSTFYMASLVVFAGPGVLGLPHVKEPVHGGPVHKIEGMDRVGDRRPSHFKPHFELVHGREHRKRDFTYEENERFTELKRARLGRELGLDIKSTGLTPEQIAANDSELAELTQKWLNEVKLGAIKPTSQAQEYNLELLVELNEPAWLAGESLQTLGSWVRTFDETREGPAKPEDLLKIARLRRMLKVWGELQCQGLLPGVSTRTIRENTELSKIVKKYETSAWETFANEAFANEAVDMLVFFDPTVLDGLKPGGCSVL